MVPLALSASPKSFVAAVSERQFFETRKRDTLRSHITDSLLANVSLPDTLKNMLRTYQAEERVAEYMEVKPANVVKLGKPTSEDLEDLRYK